jgi:beta-lactamase regulating signal transducer with metallopeptidase domain
MSGAWAELAAGWWAWTAAATWQGTLLAGMVLAAGAVGRRWPAPLRRALLAVALLKFSVPPALAAPSGVFGWMAPAAAGSVAADDLPVWLAALMLAHLLGAAACLARLGVQWRRLRRVARRARVVEEGEAFAVVQRLAGEMGMRRAPRLLLSDEAEGPFAWGLRRPAVVLPTQTAGALAAEELELVLAHEVAHHARRDLWVSLGAALVACAWWWNPAVHALARAVRAAGEDAADDAVLAARAGSVDRYCDALLRAARLSVGAPGLAAALGGGRHPLGRRLVRVRDGGVRRAPRLSAAGAALVLALAAAALPGAGRPSASTAGDGERIVVRTRTVLRPPPRIDRRVRAGSHPPAPPGTPRASGLP